MLYTEFENVCLPYLQSKKSLGLMVSGGLDSAVMLYGLCLLKTKYNLDVVFKIYTVPLHNDSQLYAENVVDWVNRKFNLNIAHVFCGDPNLEHDRTVRSGMELAFEQNENIVIADTTNPPVKLPGLAPIRVKAQFPFQPFIEWTKKETVALSIELGIDDLIALTHSCTEQSIRCNQCWQCQERAWGYAENTYPDPGCY
jgi:tRNA(Ile)-lysidine synthase TilS/MesJ